MELDNTTNQQSNDDADSDKDSATRDDSTVEHTQATDDHSTLIDDDSHSTARDLSTQGLGAERLRGRGNSELAEDRYALRRIGAAIDKANRSSEMIEFDPVGLSKAVIDGMNEDNPIRTRLSAATVAIKAYEAGTNRFNATVNASKAMDAMSGPRTSKTTINHALFQVQSPSKHPNIEPDNQTSDGD